MPNGVGRDVRLYMLFAELRLPAVRERSYFMCITSMLKFDRTEELQPGSERARFGSHRREL